MYNTRTERSAGWAGIAFVIVTVASIVIPLMGGGMPTFDLGNGQLAAVLDAHREGWLIAAWLGVPSTIFFLWFAVGVRAYLAQGPGANEGLSTYSLTAAVGGSLVGLVGGLFNGAIVFVSARAMDDSVVRTLFAFGLLLFAGLYTFTAIFTFAVAHSGRRHGTFPGWLNFIGYLSAVVSLLATIGIACPQKIFSLTGPLPMVAGLLFFLYILLLSIVIIGRAGKQTAST